LLKYFKNRKFRFLALIGLLLILYASLAELEHRMTYAPTHAWDAALPDTAVELTFANQLSAAWFPAPGAEHVIVYCHGNAGNISHRFAIAKNFQAMGWPVFLFDYRGYGKSAGGPPDERKMLLDAQNALFEAEGLVESPNDKKVIFYGRSLGSVAAIQNSGKFPHWVRGLILDSPLLSAKEMAKEVGFGWYAPLLTQNLNNQENIAMVDCPILILHGDADQIVPVRHGRELAELATSKTTLVEIPGGRHNDSRRKGLALEAIKAFIEELQH